MTTWNPPELGDMCLPPCHLLTQFHVTKGLLHQTVYMRSVDLCLGLPSDLVLYGLLHELVAQEVGLQAARMTFVLGDAHVYDNHDTQWAEQRQRPAASVAPGLLLDTDASVFNFHPGMATVIRYEPQEAIRYALN
jgi:thymidylate synthase